MSDASLGAGDEEWRRSESPRWAVLDPAGEPKDTVFSTVYVKDELLIDRGRASDNAVGDLNELAGLAGWTVEDIELEERWINPETDEPEQRSPGASNSVRVRLGVAGDSGVVAETPDAWQLLRQARANGIGTGVTLNHVLTTDSLGLNPFKANPFKANPFKANPFKANPFKANAATVGIDSYAVLGFGGLQPVTYLGPAPARDHSIERRPVIAVFDTGCGRHDWFGQGVLIPPVMRNGEPIGISDPATDPEVFPSLAVPLDGIFDDASGHGTFIAGIVLQKCADAHILPVRIADGQGFILENDLIGALGRLIELMRNPESLGVPQIDVLNLSFSYYPETLDDPNPPVGQDRTPTVSELARLLNTIQELGCVVVCSAGNEATDRPTYPAALPLDDPARHISVGALNPSDRSVAMFSNIGYWVDVYAPGVALMSTLPDTFDGGVQAGTRDDKHGHRRETLDVDDFRGGFGVWSGTSFAAPVVAGLVATGIAGGDDPHTACGTVCKKLRKKDHSRIR